MADLTYDALVVGGGNKGLVTAIYLAKYGGMSVGVLEETWELGGGLSTTEPIAGFQANTHASSMMEEYYLPLVRDFPDITEKGLRYVHDKVAIGVISEEDQKCWGQYYSKEDPDGARSAAWMEKFSGAKDADTYAKLWKLCKPGGAYYNAFLEEQFNLPVPGQPLPIQRVTQDWLKTADAQSLGIDEQWLNFSGMQAGKELWDNGALYYMAVRLLKSSGVPPEVGSAAGLLYSMLHGSGLCHLVGGTHNLAHAMQRILNEHKSQFHTRSEVTRILVENGVAKGVRLANGTEIAARKCIVANVSPHQLCCELLEPEHLSPKIIRRINNLVRWNTCITWYTFAVHELPKYKAASFYPDINLTQWIVLGKKDARVMETEQYWRYLGKLPPTLEPVVCGQHSLVDPTMAPEGKGKHVVSIEDHVCDATCLTEREWIQFKRDYAEKVLQKWQNYAPNMTWDNVIGYESITPYDTAQRHKNFGPYGDQNVVDRCYGQQPPWMPVPELARHRVANIKNLYATGSAWGRTPNASSSQGYTCYKTIAEDLGLARPWEGKPW